MTTREKTWGAAAAGFLTSGMLVGFAPLDSDAIHAAKAVATIQEIAPEAVANPEGTTQTTDPGVAVSDESVGARATIPTDAADGIQIEGVTIGLPFAEMADDASASQLPGVVVYDNNNGSATVPVIRERGTVQITTVIGNANAPKRYDYPMRLARGQSLHLNEDGSVVAAGRDGSFTAYVASPWAKDANGDAVPTHYEVSGNTLTQVVDFTAATAFPVVADPTMDILWWGVAAKLSKAETKSLASRISTAAGGVAAFCGYVPIIQARVACGMTIAWRIASWVDPVRQAATQGRCAQINVPYASGVALWNVTNEKC